jgi:hypothetical protein
MIQKRILTAKLGRVFRVNSYNRNREKKQRRPAQKAGLFLFRIRTLQIRAAK